MTKELHHVGLITTFAPKRNETTVYRCPVCERKPRELKAKKTVNLKVVVDLCPVYLFITVSILFPSTEPIATHIRCTSNNKRAQIFYWILFSSRIALHNSLEAPKSSEIFLTTRWTS